MDTVRVKDLLKGDPRGRMPREKAKEAPRRLSDLIRAEARSSAKAGTARLRPTERLTDRVRKDESIPLPVRDSVGREDGRQQRPGLAGRETSIEPAVIEQKEGSKLAPRVKRGEAPDQVFQSAVAAVREILQAVKASAPFFISRAEEAAEVLLERLRADDQLLFPFFAAGDLPWDPAVEAANVCILSVKIGLELGYTVDELFQLSLVALLHDVGMARLPEGLVEKNGPLNPAERVLLGRHPKEGAEIILGLGRKFAWLADVILQVHERVDGSGYPRALKGPEIAEHAQVVGLADVYESLVHHRTYRSRMSPVDALKEILHRERTAFPDKILKALIQALSPYPVGSLVSLNTGEIGRVLETNKDRPLRPVVEILIRGGKRPEEPAVIDLSETPLLNIRDSIVEEPPA